MNVRRLLTVIAVVALVALHYTVRPMLGWRAGIDFLVIATLLVAVRARPGAAALTGFAIGLVADALSPVAFGAGALAMTVVGYVASQLKATFYADNVLLHGLFVFVGKLVFDVILLLAERRLGGAALLAQLGLWTPIAALVTALVGIALLAVAGPAVERRRP